MKTILIILGGAAVVILIIVAITKSGGSDKKIAGYTMSDPNAPKVEMQEKKYEFGKINLNDVAKHDFKITNTGKSPLTITGIITSCHCTSAVLKIPGKTDSPEFGMHVHDNWQGELAPGAEADLEVIYKPSVMPVKGQISRVVTFSTNDPSNKEVQIEITAEVQ